MDFKFLIWLLSGDKRPSYKHFPAVGAFSLTFSISPSGETQPTKIKKSRPKPIQPNPWVDPTHEQLCCNAAGQVRPMPDILMAAGGYPVGHSGHTDLIEIIRLIYLGHYCIAIFVSVTHFRWEECFSWRLVTWWTSSTSHIRSRRNFSTVKCHFGQV